MRVRLETCMVGEGAYFEPGDILDLPEPHALRLIDSHQASPVDLETAALRPPDTFQPRGRLRNPTDTKKRARPRPRGST